MKKNKMISEVQKRLPEDIIVIDETTFEFAEDEFISILSWIKYFNWNYKINNKSGPPAIQSPIISKRMQLDFYFYWLSEDIQNKEPGFYIYIKSILRDNNGKENYKKTLREIITTNQL